MNDALRLERKLNKLMEPLTGYQSNMRAIPAGDNRTQTAAVLTEIDETILSRKLRFEAQSGRALELEVTNRRILRLSGIEPESAITSHGGLLNASLSDGETPYLEELANLFAWFLQDGGGLRVASTKMSGCASPTEMGLSVAVVADAMQLDLYQLQSPDTRSTLQRFLSAVGDAALAWAIVAGEDAGDQGGDAQMIEKLGAISDNQRAELERHHKGVTAAESACFLSVFGALPETGADVIFAKTPKSQAFLIIPSANLTDTLAVWNYATAAL